MNPKIEITELDLLTFVLFRDELNKEKKEFIESNINLFSDQINLIKQTQNPLNDELKTETILKSSLPSPRKEVIVFPLNYEIAIPGEATLTLAAKSANSDVIPLIKTFTDEEKSVLLKLICQNETTKIFLFDREGKSIENYKIIIHPSNEEIIATNNNISMSDLDLVKIERISIII